MLETEIPSCGGRCSWLHSHHGPSLLHRLDTCTSLLHQDATWRARSNCTSCLYAVLMIAALHASNLTAFAHPAKVVLGTARRSCCNINILFFCSFIPFTSRIEKKWRKQKEENKAAWKNHKRIQTEVFYLRGFGRNIYPEQQSTCWRFLRIVNFLGAETKEATKIK